MHLLITVAAVALTTIAAFKLLPLPVLWILLGWSGVCTILAVRTKRRTSRIVLVNVALVLLILAVLEGFLWAHPGLLKRGGPGGHIEGNYTNIGFYFRQNVPILGYAAQPNVQVTSRKTDEGRVLYDVVYSMDSHGLRITPPAHRANAQGVVFFGCSYTLGEGVRNEEAMPYQVGLMAGEAYQVYNFGFHGYGPHQMLAAMEYGFVESVLTVTPKYVVYQALPEHVGRAAGLSSWDSQGPRYELTSQGSVTYQGPFDAARRPPGPVEAYLHWQAQKSSIGRLILEWPRSPSGQDVARFVAIIARTKRLTETKWPGSEFHVLFWSDGTLLSRRIEKGLKASGVRVHDISESIPGINKTPGYRIPVDGHPTALAHREIARYVTHQILHVIPESQGQAPGTDATAKP